MKCKSYCKYFKEKSVGATFLFYPEKESNVIWNGYCNKYYINTSTEDDCLDMLPYDKK